MELMIIFTISFNRNIITTAINIPATIRARSNDILRTNDMLFL